MLIIMGIGVKLCEYLPAAKSWGMRKTKTHKFPRNHDMCKVWWSPHNCCRRIFFSRNGAPAVFMTSSKVNDDGDLSSHSIRNYLYGFVRNDGCMGKDIWIFNEIVNVRPYFQNDINICIFSVQT